MYEESLNIPLTEDITAVYVSCGYTVESYFCCKGNNYGFVNKDFTKDIETGENVLSLRACYNV